MGLGGCPDASVQPVQHGLSFWCPVMMVTKNLDGVTKKWIFGQKLHFCPKISFFLRYAHIAPFLASDTMVHEIKTSPCPLLNLDTFSFPVGAPSAVFWHRLGPMMLFWSEMYHMLSYSMVWYCSVLYCIVWYIYC